MDLTTSLAIYAAILSTAVFLWNVSRSLPKFTVKLVFGMDSRDNENVSGVYISLQNPSTRTVHINSIVLVHLYKEVTLRDRVETLLKYRRFGKTVGWAQNSLLFKDIDTGLPISLEAGRSHMIFIPDDVIEEFLEDSVGRKFVAQAQDALWHNKTSAVWRKF